MRKLYEKYGPLLIALLGILVGQNLPWRVYEYRKGGEDRALERTMKVSQLRKDINAVLEDVIRLSGEYNGRVAILGSGSSALELVLLSQRVAFRQNDFDVLEATLARIEKRTPRTVRLPLASLSGHAELPIGPGRPGTPGAPTLVIDEPTVGLPTMRAGRDASLVLSVGLASGSSYTDEQLMLITIDQVQIVRGEMLEFRLTPKSGQSTTYGPLRVGSRVPITFAPEADSLVVASVSTRKNLAVLDFHFSAKTGR